MPPLLTDLLQVCLVVNDFDTTVQALAQQVGIGPWKVWHYRPPAIFNTHRRGTPAPWTMKLGVAWVGQMQLEVIQPTAGDTMYQEFLQAHGEGVHHLLVAARGLGLTAVTQAWAAQNITAGQSAHINPPIRLGPLTIPPVPAPIANGLTTRFAYFETAAQLGTVLEYAQMPPGIPFRLGVNLGQPDGWVPANANQPLPNRFLTEITKVGIVTPEVDTLRQNYTTLTGVSTWHAVTFPGGRAFQAQFGPTVLEMVQPTGPGIYQDLLARGAGVQYLGFATGLDHAATVARWQALGGQVLWAQAPTTFVEVRNWLKTVVVVGPG